ncbi:MAG TPA: tetratricopeptide repeat protein [Nostocaceae cyanobacterium]|nr:tetratricopeptide repeat protein [Nostocaceae cyanobacterium]
MAEENKSSNADNFKLEATVNDQSTITQIGKVEAQNVYLTVQQKGALNSIEGNSKAESAGVLKGGNPHKSLAYWHGRKEEIEQLRQWLNSPNIPLIGIEGIGGTGKSMLATKIFEEIEGFPKRFWADVSYGAVFSDVAREVLREFGFYVPEEEGKLVQSLVKCLRSGQFLLIIDNLESVLTENRIWGSQFYSDFFQSWVESGGSSTVIVTTRERPEFPKFEWLSLQGLEVEEGTALLTELGIKGDLEEFVKIVDGHPLLLRLVADLLKAEFKQDPNLSRLVDLGLGNLQQLLTDAKVVGTHRRENVGMVLVLDASFQRLNELQKSLFLNISVFRGAIDRGMAAAVLLGSDAGEIEGELRNLVKRSLLVEKLEEKRRFEFQPVVLEYAKYKAGEQRELHQRAIYYYLLHLKQPPWQTKEDIKEYLEIFYHFYQLQDYDSAFDAILNCNDFLNLRGYYTDELELYGQLVSQWEEIDDRKNGNYQVALILLGNAYYYLGQYQWAIKLYQKRLNISRDIGDRYGEGISLNALGNIYHFLGQYQQAIEFCQQSLDISREIGDRNNEGISLMNLGNAYRSFGQYQRAIEICQQSLEISREISDHDNEGKSLNNLGNAYYSQELYPQAIEFYQQSLNIFKKIGNRNGESTSLLNLGNTYKYQGQYQRAIEFYQQSLEISKEISDRYGKGFALNNLGNVYNSLGQYQQAIEFYQQSLEIRKEIGDYDGESSVLNGLGKAYESLGQCQQAIEFYQQRLKITREIGNRHSEGLCLYNLSSVYSRSGRVQEAFAAGYQAQQIFQELGLPVEAMHYPKWLKSLINFAESGWLQLIVLFIFGLIAFPFALIWIILLLSWRLIRAKFRR